MKKKILERKIEKLSEDEKFIVHMSHFHTKVSLSDRQI